MSLWRWQRECFPGKAQSVALGEGSSLTKHARAWLMVWLFSSVLVLAALPPLLPIVSKHLSVVHEQTWLTSVTKCSFFHPFLGAELCVQCNLAHFFFNVFVTLLLYLWEGNQRCILWLKLEDSCFIPGGGFISQTQTSPQASCVSCTDRLYLQEKNRIYYAWGVLTSQFNWSFRQCFKYAQPRIMSPLKECSFFWFKHKSKFTVKSSKTV